MASGSSPIWIVLALAADLVIWFVWNPHLPPG